MQKDEITKAFIDAFWKLKMGNSPAAADNPLQQAVQEAARPIVCSSATDFAYYLNEITQFSARTQQDAKNSGDLQSAHVIDCACKEMISDLQRDRGQGGQRTKGSPPINPPR